MIEFDLIKAIAAGGDVGVWVVAFALFRMDRRILAVEYEIKTLWKAMQGRRGQSVVKEESGI